MELLIIIHYEMTLAKILKINISIEYWSKRKKDTASLL